MPKLDPRSPEWPERAAALLRAQPDLTTDRLVLRRMTLDDAAGVLEYARDPEVARFTSWAPHRSIDDSLAFLEWIVRSYERGEGANWGLTLRPDGRFVGTIGFGVVPAHRSAEVGYALARPLWGRGLTTEALVAVLDFAFGTLGLHRMIARCEPANTGSWKVMKKAGMTFEGVERGSFYAKERFADLMVWSILDDEWRRAAAPPSSVTSAGI